MLEMVNGALDMRAFFSEFEVWHKRTCLGFIRAKLSNLSTYLLRVVRLKDLTLCMLGNFSCFCCHLLTFFFKLTFSKNSFMNTVSNGLDPSFCQS